MMNRVMDIEFVKKRMPILGNRRREYNHFVQFTHSFQKLIHSRSLDHIDVMRDIIDFNRNDEIGAAQIFERRMDQRFIQIEYEALFAGVRGLFRTQEQSSGWMERLTLLKLGQIEKHIVFKIRLVDAR